MIMISLPVAIVGGGKFVNWVMKISFDRVEWKVGRVK